MAIMNQLRSPIPWIGGKHYSAQFIVSQFPAASSYDVFVDVFGGGANILLTKPTGKHLEVYNDINQDLVNCWMHLRDHAQEMEDALRSLPYSRMLYYQYHRSLHDGTELSYFERAVRWFYVLRSSFTGWERQSPSGWKCGIKDRLTLDAKTFRNSLDFGHIAERFQHVGIDCRDFEEIILQYEAPQGLRTLLYCDPPYIDSEHYYKPSKDVDLQVFHQRLAHVLNETPAMVALSYYEHPYLEELYPVSKWRRITWETIKHSQRTKETRDKAQEVLLCNYEIESVQTELWAMNEVTI